MGLDTLEGFLPEGEYAFSLIDEMGCTFVDQLNVESLEPFTVQNYTDTICDAEVTAAVQLQFNGGIEPLLHVSDELLLEALPPGEYQTQWMDAAGCIASGNIAILQFAPLEIEVEMNVGQIELDVEGGVPPYAIDWSNGDSGFILMGEPGEYTCEVNDAVGCTEQLVVELLVNIEELGMKSLAFCEKLLAKGKVAAVPGVAFGSEYTLRFSYATGLDVINDGMDRFEEFCKQM
jgi:hypothetical protein